MLTSFEMKLLQSSTATDATISLYQDAGDDIGTLMASYTTLVSAAGIRTFANTNPSIQLMAGSKYWIEARTTVEGSGLYSGWNNNNQNVRGLIKFGAVRGTSTNPASTYTVGSGELPAFRVNVVPEPSSLVAMGGLVALAALRRRKVN
jgi:hypothetical protein